MPRRPKVSDDAIHAEVARRGGHVPTTRWMAAAVGASVGAVHAAYVRLGLKSTRRLGIKVHPRLPEAVYDFYAREALRRKVSVTRVVIDTLTTGYARVHGLRDHDL